MQIVLNEDLKDCRPDTFYVIHLFILCAALKYCLGSSKTMSFKKLSYIFDNVLKKDKECLSLKKTLLPWDIEGAFRKSLLLANSESYIEMLSKGSMLNVVLTDEGDKFIAEIESKGQLSSYLKLIKTINKKETEFSDFKIGCAINEY